MMYESSKSNVCKYDAVVQSIESGESGENVNPEPIAEIVSESAGYILHSQCSEAELYEKILEIEKDSGHVIFLCALDLFLNIIYFIIYYYQFFICIIFFCIGYSGASKRNPSKIKCYMIYQSSQIGIKTMGLLFLLSLKTNTKKRILFRIENPKNGITGNIDLIIILTLLTLLFNINFLCLLRKYYNLLPLLKREPNFIAL